MKKLMLMTLGLSLTADPVVQAATETNQEKSAAPAKQKAKGKKKAPKKAEIYRCPMDTDVVSDKPGPCPKCGMDLVLEKAEAKPSETK